METQDGYKIRFKRGAIGSEFTGSIDKTVRENFEQLVYRRGPFVLGPGLPVERMTVAWITHKDNPGKPLVYGISVCSLLDTFNKELGRQIALHRLAATLDRPLRGNILAAYFNRSRRNHGIKD